jgi:hypothetical protein
VKRSVLISIPFFLLMMAVGCIWEFRIYGELVPLFAAAILMILRDLFISEPGVS